MIVSSGLGLGAIALFRLWLSRLALEQFLQSYHRLLQFTADASHEMRCPLAVTQAALDSICDDSEQLSEIN